MRIAWLFLAAALACGASTSSFAVEGSSAAGPIGGTDIRSAQLPPPGLYGGLILLHAAGHEFVDGNGKVIPALSAFDQKREVAGPFLLYVPDFQILGGSIGLAGIVPGETVCGRLFDTTPKRCSAGVGDPYVELSWSRYFGTPRPSRFAGAYPIPEGLTIELGFGMVIPIGKYNVTDATQQGLTIGNNIWDFAPLVAFTYVTKPIIAEGTEVSAKLYWNNYLTNPATQYTTGTLLNLDFAVSERIGRFQLGMAGFYAFQTADDKLFGVPFTPDGRRGEVLELGGVLAYDMPEFGSSLKIKALHTVIIANTVNSYNISVGWIKKLY